MNLIVNGQADQAEEFLFVSKLSHASGDLATQGDDYRNFVNALLPATMRPACDSEDAALVEAIMQRVAAAALGPLASPHAAFSRALLAVGAAQQERAPMYFQASCPATAAIACARRWKGTSSTAYAGLDAVSALLWWNDRGSGSGLPPLGALPHDAGVFRDIQVAEALFLAMLECVALSPLLLTDEVKFAALAPILLQRVHGLLPSIRHKVDHKPAILESLVRDLVDNFSKLAQCHGKRSSNELPVPALQMEEACAAVARVFCGAAAAGAAGVRPAPSLPLAPELLRREVLLVRSALERFHEVALSHSKIYAAKRAVRLIIELNDVSTTFGGGGGGSSLTGSGGEGVSLPGSSDGNRDSPSTGRPTLILEAITEWTKARWEPPVQLLLLRALDVANAANGIGSDESRKLRMVLATVRGQPAGGEGGRPPNVSQRVLRDVLVRNDNLGKHRPQRLPDGSLPPVEAAQCRQLIAALEKDIAWVQQSEVGGRNNPLVIPWLDLLCNVLMELPLQERPGELERAARHLSALVAADRTGTLLPIDQVCSRSTVVKALGEKLSVCQRGTAAAREVASSIRGELVHLLSGSLPVMGVNAKLAVQDPVTVLLRLMPKVEVTAGRAVMPPIPQPERIVACLEAVLAAIVAELYVAAGGGGVNSGGGGGDDSGNEDGGIIHGDGSNGCAGGGGAGSGNGGDGGGGGGGSDRSVGSGCGCEGSTIRDLDVLEQLLGGTASKLSMLQASMGKLEAADHVLRRATAAAVALRHFRTGEAGGSGGGSGGGSRRGRGTGAGDGTSGRNRRKDRWAAASGARQEGELLWVLEAAGKCLVSFRLLQQCAGV
ncbi:unnamed protein product [Phaeothamnion confervicola]